MNGNYINRILEKSRNIPDSFYKKAKSFAEEMISNKNKDLISETLNSIKNELELMPQELLNIFSKFLSNPNSQNLSQFVESLKYLDTLDKLKSLNYLESLNIICFCIELYL